jgi:hypothetical protein
VAFLLPLRTTHIVFAYWHYSICKKSYQYYAWLGIANPEGKVEVAANHLLQGALLHKGLKDRVILSNSILSDNLGVRSA